ncbi:protein kinase, partial [Moorena sp. SIO3I6]|uniref:protein kinase domain-containing protein n=1 Tax=Moorena sp. SIO3I6 TaxID=2607831 RepID=UPI0013FCF001
YIVMPFYENGTLRQFTNLDSKLEPADALNLVLPVAETLSQVHDLELYHRDLKPSNILLDETFCHNLSVTLERIMSNLKIKSIKR